MNLSIIVPVYNSSKILKTLVKRIKKNLRTKNYEIIFINDVSLDNSWNKIKFLFASCLRLSNTSFLNFISLSPIITFVFKY